MATQFKRKKALIIPTLSHKGHPTVIIKVMSKVYAGKELPPKKPGEKPEKPADLCEAVNLETGEQVLYMVPTIIKGRFEEMENAKDSPVGRCFEITKVGRRDGKRYDDYSMYEVEEPKAK